MPVRIIGIDPGVAGGFACIRKNNKGVWLDKMKGKTDKDIIELLKEWSKVECIAYIEKVGGFMGGGKGGKNMAAAHNMFTLGDNCGFIRGVLRTLEVRVEYVTPREWQKYFGLIKAKGKTESSTQKKRRHKNKAEQLFPKLKITLANADALLIAEYGRRTFKET